MKLHLPKILFVAVLAALSYAPGATYNTLGGVVQDVTNGVYYDGAGNFAVTSATTTALSITIDLNAYNSYLASNDYAAGKAMTWNYSGSGCLSYGLYDDSGTITGYWSNSKWANVTGISKDTLSQYADANNLVTLTLTSTPSSGADGGGVQVSVTTTSGSVNLYSAPALRNSSVSATTGYWVNTNYITSVTLNTASTLDVTTYEPPKDYTQAFVSERTDGTSVGRIMFQGDSITHGVADASWRWQLFKTFTDNGIENEIVGPREGYYSTPTTSDYTSGTMTYGGEEFANVHLAQASGRTRNIISGSNSSGGVNYGGNSTKTASDTYNCDTYVCLMGTNDLLSDGGYTTANFCTKMQNMIGGTVSYDETNGYTWTAGDSWGNMGTIVTDSLRQDDDVMYVLSVPCWGTHANNNEEERHSTVEQYNVLLKQWADAYSESSGKKIVYVESNRGLVDVTNSKTFTGNDAFFHAPGTASGSDGLHPNEQGSLIIAGNLARAMGIGGRTGGLRRAAAGSDGWTTVSGNIELTAGETKAISGATFNTANGYTIDFGYKVGDGSANGWASADNALSVVVSDGTNGSQLKITEGYIMWGSKVLFCQDNSLSGNETIRVAWHSPDEADNVAQGYYVWLGDMLIGQGLSATTTTENGLKLTSTGLASVVSNLIYVDEAYAPTTTGLYSEENAFIAKSKQMVSHDSGKPVSYNIDFTEAEKKTANGTCAITTASAKDTKVVLNTGSGWFGVVNSKCTGDIAAKVKDGITSGASLIGILNGGSAKTLTMVVDDAVINNGTYGGQSGAIIGSYTGGTTTTADKLQMEINGGEVKGDIVGGSVKGACDFDAVNITLNQGAVSGSIYGGSKVAEGQVGNVAITITGGAVSGDVKGGGTNGTVSGNTAITITGGVIKGSVNAKVNASGNVGGTSSVRIEGNKASIGGGITADKVTIAEVSTSEYTNAFDSYSGTITADTVELDHVVAELQAALAGVTDLVLINGSDASLKLAETQELAKLSVGAGSTFSAYHTGSAYEEANESTISITDGTATFGEGAGLNANLSLAGATTLMVGSTGVAMGSSVTLSNALILGNTVSIGQTLTLFSGVDAFTAAGETLSSGDVIDATRVFTNIGEGTISYKNGNVSLMVTPEPATATLSLLALAALAARRKRK